MKTHVSFKRDSVTLNNESQPFGEDIATAMVSSFADQGLGDGLLDSLDYAFTFVAPASTRSCYVMLGLVDDGPRQWLISCNPCRGILDWLTRRNYDDDIRSVVNAIQCYLTNDDGVTEIRWYSASDWNQQQEEWSPSP